MVRRIGIIGSGGRGVSQATALAERPDTVVTAIAEIDDTNRRSAGETLDVAEDHRYADPMEMYDSEDLNAVSITTPHSFHYDHIVAGMERGIHVFCEKPMVTDLPDARDLVRRDRESDTVLMIGYQRHRAPAFIYARRRWAEGDEVPTHISAEISEGWIQKYQGTWRVDPEISGGGFLFDTGSHLVDAILWSTGLDPAHVHAEMDFFDEDRRIDVQGSLQVRFENGTIATISVPGNVQRLSERIHVWDGAGSVYIDARHWEEYSVTEIDAEGDEHVPDTSDIDEEDRARAFIDAIEHGTEPPATAHDAFRATAVKRAAYESARTGDSVDVDLTID